MQLQLVSALGSQITGSRIARSGVAENDDTTRRGWSQHKTRGDSGYNDSCILRLVQDRRGHLKAPKFGRCCSQISEFYSSLP